MNVAAWTTRWSCQLALWASLVLLVSNGAWAETVTSRPSSGRGTAGHVSGKKTAASGTSATRGYVPAHARSTRSTLRVLTDGAAQESVAPQTQPPEEIEGLDPDMVFEDDGVMEWPGDPGYGAGPCLNGAGCLPYCPPLYLDNLEIFIGSQGFTGPPNRGETGSFGFHEGVNWSAPLMCLTGGEWASQFGMRITQSNLSGASFTTEERQQIFVTGGAFRRVDWGFQGGVVVDYLHEDWYYEANLVQLRGELSWVYPCNHEVGAWFTTNTQHQTVTATFIGNNGTTVENERLQATDLFAFFYRYRLDDCGSANGRIYGGFTGESDGLVGADMQIPINDCWAVQSSFIYLVPEQGRLAGGVSEESWNFGLSLVWRRGGGFTTPSYYRPLFNVADNGTFMVDRQ